MQREMGKEKENQRGRQGAVEKRAGPISGREN